MTPEEAELIIGPIFEEYHQANLAQNVEKAAAFYDENAVVVEKGKRAVWGKNDISNMFKEFFATFGDSQPKIVAKKFEGSENYIAFSAEFIANSPTHGEIKGAFYQIWHKNADKWLIIHDEFTSP